MSNNHSTQGVPAMTGNLHKALKKAGLTAETAFPPTLRYVMERGQTATIYVTHWSLALDADGNVYAPNWVVSPDNMTKGGTCDCQVTVSPGQVHVNIPRAHLPRLTVQVPDPGMLPATSLSFNGRGY